MGPADWIKHATIKKTLWEDIPDEERKTYNPFIMNLWLSMEPDLLETIEFIQRYQIPNKHHYNFYKLVLPKRNIYLRWIKSKKREYKPEVINIIASHYKISIREVYDSLEVLNKDTIIDILKMNSINDKQIKILLK